MTKLPINKLLLCLSAAVVLLICGVSVAQVAQPTDPLPTSCSGECDGTHWGFAFSSKACDDLTEEELEDLFETACGNTNATTAQSRADEDCEDGGPNCKCSGSAGDPENGVPSGSSSCIVPCSVTFSGTCKTSTSSTGGIR